MTLNQYHPELNLYFRTRSTGIHIEVGQNESISFKARPHKFQHDLKDMLELTVGPNDKYNGIKACLTYNPPGVSKPGYQTDRSVSF